MLMKHIASLAAAPQHAVAPLPAAGGATTHNFGTAAFGAAPQIFHQQQLIAAAHRVPGVGHNTSQTMKTINSMFGSGAHPYSVGHSGYSK